MKRLNNFNNFPKFNQVKHNFHLFQLQQIMYLIDIKINYLDWGAKKTDKIIPPDCHPIIPGLKCSSNTTYKNHYP